MRTCSTQRREINLVRFNTGPSERDVNYVVGLRGASSTLWAKVVLNKEKRLRRHILAPVIDTVINKYTIRPSKTRPLCIIVPLNEMCYKLQEYYKGKGYTVGVYNAEESKNKTTKEIFNNQIILTNSAMFSKGIDIPKLKWLINFNSVSSLIALEQVVGRLRGSESDEDHKVYIDCIDMSYGDGFIKQQKIRKRYYKKITTDEELLKEKNVFIIE